MVVVSCENLSVPVVVLVAGVDSHLPLLVVLVQVPMLRRKHLSTLWSRRIRPASAKGLLFGQHEHLSLAGY